MYLPVPRKGDISAYYRTNAFPNAQVGSQKKIPEALIASIGFPVIVLTLAVTCLSFIKRSARYLTGKKTKKAVQCTRMSMVSISGSVKMYSNRPMRIQEFREHYKDVASDSFYKLTEEFEALKGHSSLECSAAEMGLNRPKNRFVNVLPFDHSRFHLKPIEGIGGSDYINANYVSGYCSPREFIATQGPLKSTVPDFWRMIWESETKCIVMLTRCNDKDLMTTHYGAKHVDREKCHRYWPSCSLPEMYGEIEVEMDTDRIERFKPYHKWVVTEFKLRKDKEERSVRHYQFLTWPDFGAIEPPEALIHLVGTVREFVPYPKKGEKPPPPIIIHCSAGVGRSGTFIAMDSAMQQLKMERTIDIVGLVHRMRQERVWMVQTEQQYICIYKCILALLDLEDLDAKSRLEKKPQGPVMTKEELEEALDMDLDYEIEMD